LVYFSVLHDLFSRFKDQETLGRGGHLASLLARSRGLRSVIAVDYAVAPPPMPSDFRDCRKEGAVIVGKDGFEKQLPLEKARNFSVFEREKITLSKLLRGSTTAMVEAGRHINRCR
jgi:hypothetical protein